MKVTAYLGGGKGPITLDLGAAIPSLADVASSITARTNVNTAVAQSNAVQVAAGQTVIVTANVGLTNNSGSPLATNFLIGVVSGPTSVNGPSLSTPTIAAADVFPLGPTAAFTGLAPGTYVFGLFIDQSRGPGFAWGIGDWEVVTQIVG